MKLFWKIYLAVVIPAVVIGSLCTYMIAAYELSDEQEHTMRVNTLASRLLTGQIEKEYVESRWPFDSLKKLSQDDDFLFWWIVTDDGTIHLANDTSFIGTQAYTYFPQIEPVPDGAKSFLDKKQNCGVVMKFFGKGKRWSFWLGFSLKRLAELQSKIIQISALLLVLTVGTLAVAVYFTVNHFTRPIKGLTEGVMIVGKGNLNHRVQVQSKDELGYLAHSFNEMAEHLEQTTTSIDNLKREITERKKAEEQIEKLAKFPSENPYPVLRIGSDGTIVYANKPSIELLREKKSGMGEPAPPEWQRLTKQVLDSGVVERSEVEHAGRVFEICAVPVVDAGYANFYGADVTERKKAEQAMEQLNKDLESTVQELSRTNKELKDFIRITAHDLKTPLRGIVTLADWITTDYGDKLDEHGKHNLQLLKSRIVRMNKLLDGILKYSKIGRNGKQREEVNLNTLMKEAIDEIAPPKNIEIITKNELPTIMCVKMHPMQIFQNLLSNAIRFMDKPQGYLRIGCVEENSFWKFSVADNGPGIEEKYFEKIFQIFQTLSPRDEIESTGVGLTAAKKNVELYGGKIWVQSKLGEGSTFFFTLPKQEIAIGVSPTDTL